MRANKVQKGIKVPTEAHLSLPSFCSITQALLKSTFTRQEEEEPNHLLYSGGRHGGWG